MFQENASRQAPGPPLEIHLLTEPVNRPSASPPGASAAAARALPVAFKLIRLRVAAHPEGLTMVAATEPGHPDDLRVEPFYNRHHQIRLLAWFIETVSLTVNGVPAPRLMVLAPGDWFQWLPGLVVRVALFSRPRIGPPPPAFLGKECPVCRVPLTAGSQCYSCLCGVVFHYEMAVEGGLQCAQMLRECPVCQRPVVLAEGYINPPGYET